MLTGVPLAVELIQNSTQTCQGTEGPLFSRFYSLVYTAGGKLRSGECSQGSRLKCDRSNFQRDSRSAVSANNRLNTRQDCIVRSLQVPPLEGVSPRLYCCGFRKTDPSLLCLYAKPTMRALGYISVYLCSHLVLPYKSEPLCSSIRTGHNNVINEGSTGRSGYHPTLSQCVSCPPGFSYPILHTPSNECSQRSSASIGARNHGELNRMHSQTRAAYKQNKLVAIHTPPIAPIWRTRIPAFDTNILI